MADLPTAVAKVEAKVCGRCQVEVAVSELIQKACGRTICKSCNGLATYLSRLDIPPSMQLQDEEKLDFFRSAQKLRDDSGKISLSKIREEFATMAKVRTLNTKKDKQEGAFLPLSRWAALGHTETELDNIEKYGEREEHPVAWRRII